MIEKKLKLNINYQGIDSEVWALFDEKGKLDLVPTVLFAEASKEQKWAKTTLKVYAQITQFFFATLRHFNISFQNIASKDTRGFMQGYYHKQLPTQKSSKLNTSENRMKAVSCVLSAIFQQAIKLGILEPRTLSLHYKIQEVSSESKEILPYVDQADRIYENYIPNNIFQRLLAFIVVESEFAKQRDQLALRLGYECGIRTEELTRGSNFSLNRLREYERTWKFGKSIEWQKLLGKGKNGGKTRTILIKPDLAHDIFDFMNQYSDELANSVCLFSRSSGATLSPKHGTNIFRSARDNFNDANVNKKSYQKLRHSYATNLALWCIETGKDKRLVQDRLGHGDFATTEIYIEVAHLILGNQDKANELRAVRLKHKQGKGG